MDRISLQIKSSSEWKAIAAKLGGWDFEKFPRKITIEPDKGEPVQDCIAVFWIWMAQMSKEFTTGNLEGHTYTRQYMHDVMCNHFLGWTDGYHDDLTGKHVEPRMITLTYPEKKTKERMCVLLDQIDEWARDRGVFLITKRTSDYAKYRESQL